MRARFGGLGLAPATIPLPPLAKRARVSTAPPPRARASTAMAASSSSDANKNGRVDADAAVVFVCDVQERFRAVVDGFAHCVHVSSVMCRAAEILDLPIVCTEQYPEKLGATVEELQPALAARRTAPKPKKLFSMVTPEVAAALDALPKSRDVALVMGLEAHVCVLQTAMDLLDRGMTVHVLVDGVSSQRAGDRAVALARLASTERCFLSTSETALFQMLKTAESECFKPISALVREPRPEPPLPSV
jgi:nicotinamidase-related amidase|eukprot:31375-Pelagococcus_subviridis.AAC.5